MEEIMRVISDNRVWILSLLLLVEIPVLVWMVLILLKDGYMEFENLTHYDLKTKQVITPRQLAKHIKKTGEKIVLG